MCTSTDGGAPFRPDQNKPNTHHKFTRKTAGFSTNIYVLTLSRDSIKNGGIIKSTRVHNKPLAHLANHAPAQQRVTHQQCNNDNRYDHKSPDCK